MQQQHAHITQSLERAWQHQDFAALGGILADTLEWRETPFQSPLTTKAQVLELWQTKLATQSDVNIHLTLLDFAGSHSYHRCVATYTDTKTGAHSLDGLIRVELNPEGRITSYTLWPASH